MKRTFLHFTGQWTCILTLSDLNFQTPLNDTNPQLFVHWAGKDSNVLIALSKTYTIPILQESKVYITRDYGRSFESITLNVGSRPAVIDRFYIHKLLITHVSKPRMNETFLLNNLFRIYSSTFLPMSTIGVCSRRRTWQKH